MLSAIARAFEKVNVFLLSLVIATLWGTHSFAAFAVAMSYALIIFSVVEVGGQQLYTYFNREVGELTPKSLNGVKCILFVLQLPLVFLGEAWLLTGLLALAYFIESLSNSFRYQLFQEHHHKKEALFYLSERLIWFFAISMLYAADYFSLAFTLSLTELFIFLCTLKLVYFILYGRLSKSMPVNHSFSCNRKLYQDLLKHGKYFIVSAFVASLFMQVDILVFDWLGASEQEIAIISAFVRLVTATFFISTVLQQFVLPKFDQLQRDAGLFSRYEVYTGRFAFFLTVSLMALSDIYLLAFFGGRMEADGFPFYGCALILLLVFSRFCRDPVSFYLGQNNKNKTKVKILVALLPLKALAVCLSYQVFGVVAGIISIVVFDALVYWLFRYYTAFNNWDKNYLAGVFLLFCFSFVVVYLPLFSRIAIAAIGVTLAYLYFSKMTKPGVLFK
ncbi:hypothetical protein SG34_021560 [Thalassomonas viridans]|uniref:Uncharacterized protein n=1 Tax=Thalassomonas viridans TaxID=137584 RepID=A0AAE9YZT2_9GAMM|nr:hypothetical protein [Thalassomonas viridans]WDE03933.1 hypothetical protein SG34_021560 [Thalassomonas viridans]